MYRYGVYDVEQDEGDPHPDFVGKEETYDLTPDLWTDVEDYIKSSKEADNSPSYLNNQDYTLNSPLICDELDAFKEYLTKGKKAQLYYNKSWDSRVSWMKTLSVDWSNVKPTSEYHKACAELWLRESSGTAEFRKLIEKTDEDSKKTYSILEAYLKGWTNRIFPFQSRRTNSEETLKYGSYMMEMLKVSWILNAGTEYELTQLKDSIGFSDVETVKGLEAVRYKSQLLGTVIIGHGVAYFEALNMLWDRAMILMFKDTATARFHTLFAIQHRYADYYHSTHLSSMEKMYKLGDAVLMGDTKVAYEAFGMIEPLSSLKLSELAGDFRPLIPRFPHFRSHVESKIAELSAKNPKVADLFNHLHTVNDKRLLLSVYGSFRHWGHPFIDYFTGLEALYQNVSSTKEKIDASYAELLASDLAFKILRKEFWTKYTWYVDIKKVPEDNPLYEHIKNNTWPSSDILLNYPPEWHKLPLLPCWEIPKVVDPAIIYSDKTHSITKSELIKHLKQNPHSRIPTKKVLHTLLTTKSTDWPAFLKEIDAQGLQEDDLVIGLKAKEREIKWKGRFFALMSWRLREYFVFTEYLIKKNVIPLFKGLTMADDQTTLIKKMIQNTSGQGGEDYKHITVANHIDYEKWNNFQRYESTAPVFKVIGQFFGLPNLFVRTHEFFEKSLVYYRDRPDLMKVVENQVHNRDESKRVCWNGQKGGLEGLRQKGWSVLNLLVIERESRIRNTEIKTLAQGDNQVICTQYEINPSKTEAELSANILAAMQNNDVIIAAIRSATAKIGLRINEDETLQAADLLIYGKTIVFRGNLTCLEEKRYSRVTCTTNDQLPSLGNVLSTVSTNCLTIAHYSKSPLNAMMSYNWLSNLVINILSLHNPALRTNPATLVSDPAKLETRSFRIAAIYLDPSLGGIAGMSLTRFHLRMFPDPVTEGLSFWKIVYSSTTDIEIKKLSIVFGAPKLMRYTAKNFEKLIEDPASLNIPRGLSAQNLIKEEIKNALFRDPSMIKHEVIKDAVLYVKKSEKTFVAYLASVTPCFPRFISEFRSSTYFGLTSSILGLFENSKTIRNVFKRKFRSIVDQAIIKCELASFESLIGRINQQAGTMWTCSASQSDDLRKKSWNRAIIGTTVPHPAEMISDVTTGGTGCNSCGRPRPFSIHLVVLVPQGLAGPEDVRGPYPSYLGSSTGESTSLIQSWEKDTDISFLKKASRMRRAFHWFVDPNSNLGKSINSNLKGLTGEDPGTTISGFKRTGSSLHRFGCSRVSAGGYIANSPVYGSRMIISTDNFQLLGDTNYDFMYQSLMLYGQQSVGEIHGESLHSETYHFHIGCKDCLRKIEEPTIDSPSAFTFPDVSQRLSKWKASNVPWMNETLSIEIPKGKWDSLSQSDQSREVGVLHGVIFGNLGKSYADTNVLNGLFPHTLRNKLHGAAYLLGLRDGLYRAAAVDAMHRRVFYRATSPDEVISACYSGVVNSIVSHADFLAFTQGESIVYNLKTYSHRVPSSYPLNNTDLGVMAKSFLSSFTYNQWRGTCYNGETHLWIFADFVSPQLSGVLIIAYELARLLCRPNEPGFKQKCRELSDLLSALRNGEVSGSIQNLVKISSRIYLCDQEVRHAIKYAKASRLIPMIKREPVVFTSEMRVPVQVYTVEYTSQEQQVPSLEVPRIQNPLVSGLRIPQIATGSFLKVDGLLTHLKLMVRDALVGGDGSGGISALVLRKYDNTRLIFNSLMNMEGVDLSGALPSPPSAIDSMPDNIKSRCVNLNNAWANSMDLSKENTWVAFIKLKKLNSMKINLAIFDMEVQDDKSMDRIEQLMEEKLPLIMETNCTVIIKSYAARLLRKQSLLSRVCSHFHSVMFTQNLLSSSHTSEVYIVCQHLRNNSVVRLYPRWDKLIVDLQKIFCFHDYESEFKRALQVMALNVLYGIPVVYLPDPMKELEGIWGDLSKDKISIAKWVKLSGDSRSSMKSYALATLTLIGNQVLNTTSWKTDQRLEIPGDQILSKFFAYYIGVHLYIALLTNNVELAKLCQYMIDEPFLIYFYQIKKNKMDGHGRFFHSLGWSIDEKAGWVNAKRVFVQNRLALIGSVIRYHAHLSKSAGMNRDHFWSTRLLEVNRNLTQDHINRATGVYNLLY
ncbi:RNA-dependent RNA polymerase [Culex pseudovishnui rhabdo-like virus]|uniref:Replicase n=1 Tax=Culex pseudovishnui rhabdo-like virus TaxID=2684265 RepID=A0A6F8PZ67_9RHAB|nr:RNA-dependent RNA polymerase [Culex pseudovishnui rhabdo-like virus]BBQ04832.1 RNA-dependent RNA polymerase [Culex pseudovishnui rhabdo-like virus]